MTDVFDALLNTAVIDCDAAHSSDPREHCIYTEQWVYRPDDTDYVRDCAESWLNDKLHPKHGLSDAKLEVVQRLALEVLWQLAR